MRQDALDAIDLSEQMGLYSKPILTTVSTTLNFTNTVAARSAVPLKGSSTDSYQNMTDNGQKIRACLKCTILKKKVKNDILLQRLL